MSVPIVMPQVGQDLTEGVLVEWNVKVGDVVKKGDVVALVESEKASFEVEAYEEGTVSKLLYKAGDLATVLEPILFLDGEDEAGNEEVVAASDENVKQEVAEAKTASQVEQAKSSKQSSSPLARRIAEQNGLDITMVAGTGPKGSVIKRDIDKALNAHGSISSNATSSLVKPSPLPAANDEDVEVPFTKMRQVIADRLLLSKQTIPHFYLSTEVDITDTQIRRKAHLELTGEKYSLNDIVVHASALTLLEYPKLNAFVSNDGVILKGKVNVGVAVSVEDGLMVPVIEDVPQKALSDISQLISNYAAAARRGINKSVTQGTFSISNLGMFDVNVFPIINPPEAGILGVGAVKRELREYRGGIHGRDILTLTLAADHRAVDGVYGAQFLQSLKGTIESYNQFE